MRPDAARVAVGVAVRVAAVLGLVLVLFPLGGGVALAHGGGLEPVSSLPRILAVEPPVAGLIVTVIESGARLRIDNGSQASVDVLPPPGLVRSVEPVVPPGATARWADSRIVAVAAQVPAAVPGSWAVPLRVGDQDVTIRGDLVRPPSPAAWVWWTATAIAAVVTALLGRRAPDRRPAAAAVAGATVLVVGAHVVHILGAALVPEGQPYLLVAAGAAGIGIVAWLFGAAGVVLTAVGRPFGLLLCAVAGAMLAMVTAFDTSSFSLAVLPFGWSPALDRATTVLTFGVGIGLFLSGFAVLRALTPPSTPPTSGGTAPEGGAAPGAASVSPPSPR